MNKQYKQMAWEIMEIFTNVPFNCPFVPYPKTGNETLDLEIFLGDHYDLERIILNWYKNEAQEKKYIPETKLFTFAKELRPYVDENILERWGVLEKAGIFSFPEKSIITENFPYSKQDLQNLLEQEEVIRNNRRIKEVVINSGIIPKDVDRDKTGDFGHSPK